MVRVKILGSGVGADKIELNGENITDAVTAIELKMGADSITEIKLTLIAEVDLELEAHLLALEKAQHVRFNALNSPKTAFIRTR